MKIKVKKISDLAILPTRAYPSDAGYDLYSAEDGALAPGARKLFKTNLILEIPAGYYGRIAPRSGLALKNGIDVLAGVVDASYRNDIGVILINLGTEDFIVKIGERIAQLIIEKCHDIEFAENTELADSERQINGFGSSGK